MAVKPNGKTKAATKRVGAGAGGARSGAGSGGAGGARSGAGSGGAGGARTGSGSGGAGGARTGAGSGGAGGARTGAGTSADTTTEFLDPEEARTATGEPSDSEFDSSDGSDSGSTGPKRGRPLGSTKAAKEKVQNSLKGIEGILLSLHTMAATIVKVPELQLTDDEAKTMAVAIDRVASFYDVGASDKTLAWVNLAMCVGGIYGSRVFAYSIRVKAEAEAEAAKKKARPTPITQFAEAL